MAVLPRWVVAAHDVSLIAETSATITPFRLQVSCYAAVVRVITVWALSETDKLWCMAASIVFNNLRRSVCSGVFRVVNSRPCIHELINIIGSNGR
jgi:hypothetical protein